MKIYTKKGDTGTTSLIGGTKVAKHHSRIEAYGTVDELNANIGLLGDQLKDENDRKVIRDIQQKLFIIGSSLASDPERSKMSIPSLTEKDVALLENEMDRMNDSLPDLKAFILPGGHPLVSQCHIARCICRRAERKTTWLAENEKVEDLVIKYLNRLSDYFFVLARKVAKDTDTKEIEWSSDQ